MEKEIINQRTKPQLPGHLAKFAVLYAGLGKPIGPRYAGNKSFEIDTLPKDVITFIKENQSSHTVTEMTRVIVNTENLYVRAETVSDYYHQGEDTKLWQTHKSDYLKRFQQAHASVDHLPGEKENRYKALFKPLVIFLIENSYEYFQVALILGRTPATIRIWANSWGYKELSLIHI